MTSAALFSYTLKYFSAYRVVFCSFWINFPSFQKKSFSFHPRSGTPKIFSPRLSENEKEKCWEENGAWKMKWMMLNVKLCCYVGKVGFSWKWEKSGISSMSGANRSQMEMKNVSWEPCLRVIREIPWMRRKGHCERASNAQRCNIPSAHIQLPLSPQIVKIARPLAGDIVKRIFFVCYSEGAEKSFPHSWS